MSRHFYFFEGLRIASEFPIVEWKSFEVGSHPGTADVFISMAAPAEKVEVTDKLSHKEYRFRVRDAAEFTVLDGREIRIVSESGKITRTIRIFLIGSAWGILLYQRGAILLHASAIQTPHGAVLFCGKRGNGKSTLAAFAESRGYALVSDDLCVVSLETSIPTIYPAIARLRLWEDTIRALGRNLQDHEPDHVRPGKYYYLRVQNPVTGPTPVAGIYLLEWSDEDVIKPLTGFVALSRFVTAATWRGHLLMRCGDPGLHVHQYAQLLSRMPLLEFRRRRDLSVVAAQFEMAVRNVEGKGREPLGAE